MLHSRPVFSCSSLLWALKAKFCVLAAFFGEVDVEIKDSFKNCTKNQIIWSVGPAFAVFVTSTLIGGRHRWGIRLLSLLRPPHASCTSKSHVQRSLEIDSPVRPVSLSHFCPVQKGGSAPRSCDFRAEIPGLFIYWLSGTPALLLDCVTGILALSLNWLVGIPNLLQLSCVGRRICSALQQRRSELST